MDIMENLLKTRGACLEKCSRAHNFHIQFQGLSMLLEAGVCCHGSWVKTFWTGLPSTAVLKSLTGPSSALKSVCLGPFRPYESFLLISRLTLMLCRTYYSCCLTPFILNHVFPLALTLKIESLYYSSLYFLEKISRENVLTCNRFSWNICWGQVPFVLDFS